MAARLTESRKLKENTLFELLLESQPENYEPGKVRTLQRSVREWRATAGPEKEVFFAQVHRPGEAMQTDFTWGNELGITIAGAPFRHLLCHPVLPFSNWEWVTVCGSESMAAIKRGVQAALFRLGRVPLFHQTDNSTGATHDLPSGKRDFNRDYCDFVAHFGMKPRTIEPGQSHQNGDVEALDGAFKRRVEQHLLVRGSRDFQSIDVYESWLQAVAERCNRPPEPTIAVHRSCMPPPSGGPTT